MEEGQHIEFKKSLSNLESILQSIVGFANDGGGELFIGISDEGKIIGASIGKNTVESLAREISKNIQPPILPEIHSEKREDKIIIVIKIKKSEVKPHFYKSIAYKRSGKTNIQLTPQEIEEMIKARIQIRDFDERTEEATTKDIDNEAFEKFKSHAREKKRVEIANLKDEEILQKLNLVEGNKLKNAATFLFAENPSRYFPFFSFKCAVSKTSEFDLEQLVDIQSYEKPFFLLIEELVDYVIRYIPKRVYLEGLRIREDPIIPVNALREMVVNSLIHRDYEIPSPNYILITPDFIEIRNPGGLPKGLSISDLYRLHTSILRNDLIAKTIYNSGYMDKWGSGTTKIIDACAEFSLMPEFISEKNFFRVRISFKPSEEVVKVIEILGKKRMGSADLAKRLKVSDRTARKMLSDLVEKRIVKRVREKNQIFYEVPASIGK